MGEQNYMQLQKLKGVQREEYLNVSGLKIMLIQILYVLYDLLLNISPWMRYGFRTTALIPCHEKPISRNGRYIYFFLISVSKMSSCW